MVVVRGGGAAEEAHDASAVFGIGGSDGRTRWY